MNAYDPLDAPNPGEWLALDEGERLRLVIEHHRQTGVELPSEESHAAIHVVVENQAALGDEVPTQATLARLMREGLDRHNAVHAVGSVLITHVQGILGDAGEEPDPNTRYFGDLKRLTAAKWLEEFS